MEQNTAKNLSNVIALVTPERAEKFLLTWIDPNTGKEYPAGVGFHLGEFGEYTLKVDALSRPFFLRPMGVSDGRVDYRVEVVVRKKNGAISHRAKIGSGYSDPNTGGMVIMDIGPFSRLLVMRIDNE